MAESADIVFVHAVSLVVPAFPAFDLIEETGALLERIVQLREAIRDLHAAHEQFETVGELRVVGAALGQRRDLHRIVDNVRGLDQSLFREVAKERLDGFAVRQLRTRPRARPSCDRRPREIGGDDRLESGRVLDLGHGDGLGQFNGQGVRDRLRHPDAGEGVLNDRSVSPHVMSVPPVATIAAFSINCSVMAMTSRQSKYAV